MNDATAAVLFLSTLGVLYQWPHLRTTAGRLLKWVVGILFTVLLLTMICASLASIESLQIVSPLYAAASAGDRVRTAELLEYKHVQNDINVGKRSGLGLLFSTTPLNVAAQNNHRETVAALLKAGADPDGPGWTLGLGLLASITPLAGAVGNGHTKTVAALLKAGADPNDGTTLGLGLLGSGTPLSKAVENGHTETVAALLKAGADPNTPMTYCLGLLASITPLSIAAGSGHTETVAALLEAGADPNQLYL